MPKRSRHATIAAAALGAAVAAAAGRARAELSFNVDPNGWPNAAQRTAAVNAMQSVVSRYNAYGDFGNANVYVYYNAGIPTAQANYLGSIGFGGTYPNERVAMHELAHYLGSGTFGTPWDGPRGESLVDQFDGIEASLQGDSQHFWPYGLNYDSEGSEINKQRQVALVYAQRADMGIGSTANPGASGAVSLRASDAAGESGFNYASTWSDNHFAHAGAAYATGNFLLRTPASGNSFTFAGDSLRVNNTNGTGGGLQYKGTGTTAVTTFKNLIIENGRVRHSSGAADVFRLAGKVTLVGTGTLDAAQGPIQVTANIGGTGSLNKAGSNTATLTGGNTYTGATTISAGTLRLAPATAVASYTFDSISGASVINGGTGGAAMNGTLAHGATVIAGGRFGNAVRLTNGASVDINNPIADLGNSTSWTVSAWVKTTTPGGSILTKGDGAGWNYGNTIFYLGDGSAGGGGIPGGVRYAGGFLQGAPGSRSVTDNAWHQVTYVNDVGNYSIYVDGAGQPLSAGNRGFSVPDFGSVVRLGVSTNTVAADGTVNFNGLLDNVQFHNQALSPAQIAASYQGRNLGPLPSTTNVTIAGGATLDVNGMTQQIGSLTGSPGSAVTLGAGELIVNSPVSTYFAGTISGAGGSLTKAGAGTLALGGRATHTGPTTVTGGTLAFGASSRLRSLAVAAGATAAVSPGASATVVTDSLSLSGTSGAWDAALDVVGGAVAVNYAPGETSPLQTVADQVRSARRAGWAGGGITSSLADSSRVGVGYAESAFALGPAGGVFGGEAVDGTTVLIRATLYGDADLDGTVAADDLLALRRNFGARGTRALWQTGDFDYDGRVGPSDFRLLRQNYGASMPAAAAGMFMTNLAAVPEPTSAATVLVPLGVLALRRRRRVAKHACSR
jgi:autotransporter-associated beta strand protein